MIKLLSTAAAIALSLGAASVSAKAESPIAFTGVQTDKPAVAQAGCFYKYQYYYVNGVLYYQYRYICY